MGVGFGFHGLAGGLGGAYPRHLLSCVLHFHFQRSWRHSFHGKAERSALTAPTNPRGMWVPTNPNVMKTSVGCHVSAHGEEGGIQSSKSGQSLASVHCPLCFPSIRPLLPSNSHCPSPRWRLFFMWLVCGNKAFSFSSFFPRFLSDSNFPNKVVSSLFKVYRNSKFIVARENKRRYKKK